MLTPTDHPYGTKRPPIDTGYYEAYNRDNVTLVDVRRVAHRRDRRHRRAADGRWYAEYELDTHRLRDRLRRHDGHAAEDRHPRHQEASPWPRSGKSGPRTYLGLQVAGFPNLFTITGPGSPSVLTNMPVAIEQHVDWISDCIEYMRTQWA